MKKYFINGFLVMASLLVTFLVFEVGTRIIRERLFFFDNFLTEYFFIVKSAYPAELDKALGYKPKSNYAAQRNPWSTKVTLIDHGIRSNGTSTSKIPSRPSILCVGDSFTFGDAVNDNEAWPAYLEKSLGIHALNGGVFGYGLDQSILRAEQLVPVLKPDFLIVATIQDDVRRCEYSIRSGVYKPYFTVANGELLLHKPLQIIPKHELDRARRILGYSCFFHRLFFKFSRPWWIHGYLWKGSRVHENGMQVSCLLMERLADFSRRSGVPTMVAFLYAIDEPPEIFSELSACVRHANIPLWDPYQELMELRKKNPAEYKSLFDGHMTAKGNRVMAEMMTKFMRDRGLVPGQSQGQGHQPGGKVIPDRGQGPAQP